MNKIIVSLLMAGMLCLGPAASLSAQSGQGAAPMADEKDILHLNTIGAFSAGFVIQSYGYIGVLADAMSKGVYEPELVRSMLSETISYLRNVNTQLQKYQSGSLIASGDRKFIASMMEIISQLIAEAEALSSFAQTKSKEDLARYEDARRDAWKNIKKTFGMN
ncbi:hypothetical protein C4J81_09595 [Deltaproteobacteria bacterium Smac51]|nr:hypothetical protein C4J81_09595 [Deltaproteobacteria bacterium Smac51]